MKTVKFVSQKHHFEVTKSGENSYIRHELLDVEIPVGRLDLFIAELEKVYEEQQSADELDNELSDGEIQSEQDFKDWVINHRS